MLRKNGDPSQNGGSYNDHSAMQMGTAMFDESGSDIKSCSESLSIASD